MSNVFLFIVCLIIYAASFVNGAGCKNCAADKYCAPNTGDCRLCNSTNYKPPKCTECRDGRWGVDCTMECGKCNNGKCHQSNGTCIEASCQAGFLGPDCNATCDTGSWGFKCARKCGGCQSHLKCEHEFGFCPGYSCKTGYIGSPFCNTRCQKGYYGDNCTHWCGGCKYRDCNATDGTCLLGCRAGLTGPRCNQTCGEGRYGENCKERCNCPNCTRCGSKTGQCLFTFSENVTSCFMNMLNGNMSSHDTQVHHFWHSWKGGLVGSAAFFVLVIVIVIIVCIAKRGKRRKLSLLEMHRVQRQIQTTQCSVDAIDNMDQLQGQLRARLAPPDGESSYTEFPSVKTTDKLQLVPPKDNDDDQEEYVNFKNPESHYTKCPTTSQTETPKDDEDDQEDYINFQNPEVVTFTPRREVTSTASDTDYVTSVASPGIVQSEYMNYPGATNTANPYNSHKFFQVKEETYVNSLERR